MKRYRITTLTPVLVGDGRRLAPIDYMVWRDHVNVLDQARIIRLLAKGPRLEGYLMQLRRAQKLDFASWGGFAQNYAGRRIPLEHPSLAPAWEQTAAEHLFIPTFAASAAGAYVPGSAIKGALRTAFLASRVNGESVRALARAMEGDRPPRQLGPAAEALALRGSAAVDGLSVGDSRVFDAAALRVRLLRTAKLPGGWKPAPLFVEMAEPGTVFEGRFAAGDLAALFAGVNAAADAVLASHRRHAEAMMLPAVAAAAEALRGAAREAGGSACVFPLGFGAGFLSKTILPEALEEERRQVLRQVSALASEVRTGMPFPKTRRVVYAGGSPATLPGWVRLEVAAC